MNIGEARTLGFRFLKFLEIFDWKTLEITPDIKISTQENCPADKTKLSIFVSHVGKGGSQKIRLGLCKNCGYYGFMDRPSRGWMEEFYLGMWDEDESRDIQDEISKRKPGVLSKDRRRKKDLLKFLSKFNISKDKYVLEIGSGYGGTLKEIRDLGFKKVLGLESSLHRAEISRKAYELEIFSAPFEDTNLQKNLQKFSPFGLIVTHHVLEHTYEPDRILNLASGLQSQGDFLMISVPNSEGEFSASEFFFLPHLHSFTPESLERLLNWNGYEILNDSLSVSRNIIFLAVRKDNPVQKYSKRDYFAMRLEKFKKGFGLGRSYNFSPRRLWWDRKIDVGGQAPFFKNRILEEIHWPFASQFNKLYRYRRIYISELGRKKWLLSKRIFQSALVSDIEKRFTNFEESPIEIQFEGNVKLAYK